MAGFSVFDILNTNSKPVQAEKQNTYIRKEIDIEKIKPSKENFYSTNEIEDLKSSIEMFGILQDLLVVETENGDVRIIAGHRRYYSSLALVREGKQQYNKMPCRVELTSEAIREKLMLIMTNSTIRVLSDWEKVQQAAELKKLLKEYARNHELPGRLRDYIAEVMNVSPTQAGRLDKIDRRLSEEYKESLKNENIALTTAEELSSLSTEEQKMVFEQTGGKTKLNEVKKFKEDKEITNAESEPEPAFQIIEGTAKPKVKEAIEPITLKIRAAEYVRGVLETQIEKCANEIQVARQKGKANKEQQLESNLEYLGEILIYVQDGLFKMTGKNMFDEGGEEI